jgi:alpha-tubulin suppressor-like RCC1 family protein
VDPACSCTTTPFLVAGLDHVISIAPGLAVRDDGTVWGWGTNNYGQLGPNPGTFDTPFQIPGISDVRSVTAMGGSGAYALKNDGTVWAWGYNADGQLGNGTVSTNSCKCSGTPSPITGLTDVTAITDNGAALRADGTVWAWGNDSVGTLGQGTLATNDCGCSPVPVQVVGLTNIVGIAATQTTDFALRADGTVWAWGNNREGELGQGTITQNTGGCDCDPTPTAIPGLTAITAIAADGSTGYALHQPAG